MPGGGSVPASRWPLVARDDELTALRALLVDPARRGVLVCGPAGVGKTRLAEEFLALATATGRAGGRVTGSAAAAEVPLGGLAHLLPPTVGHDRFDPVALFSTAANTFRAEAGGQPYVLLADDLPRLDATARV